MDAPPFAVLFCITAILLHEEIMLLIQVIPGDFQTFTEPLEMNDLSFPQDAQRCQNSRIFCKVNEVFISGAGFLLCCTFVSVMCYVKWIERFGFSAWYEL